MYKTYQKPIINAFPDVKVSEPKISIFVLFLVKILSKFYLFSLIGFAKIVLHDDKILFDVFKRALNKESRCIIAFRHPDGREPQILTYLFLFRLKKLAAKQKIKLKRRAHAIFVYGYEVVRWGGALARFFMPNMGALPIHHTKMDSKGMERLYNAIYEGPYPLALAPEGQVSYSTDFVPRLENGVVRIGFQAASHMEQNDNGCPLEILPLSFHFRFSRSGKSAMFKLLKRVEKLCKLHNENRKLSFEERLNKCREYILRINEARYAIQTDSSLSFNERLEKTVETALVTSERMLGIESEGDFFARLYKVRHLCWDRIFLPDEENLDKTVRVKRSVLDLKAGEAWHIARHQELADFGWYFKHPLPNENTPLHQKVEYVQNLFDFANRTMGGALSNRANIPPSKVIIKMGSPINLTERLTQYKSDKRETINTTLSDLEKAYINCIEEVNKKESN